MKPSYNQIRGFTLIELMIVMVMVGVLMAVAIPGYKKSVQKSHRSQAEQLMQAIASKEVEFMLDARVYTAVPGASTGSGGLALTNSSNQTGGSSPFTCAAGSSTCSNAFYTLVVTVPSPQTTPPSFSITATAIGQQVGDGNLNLNSLGVKTRLIGTVDQGW